MALTTEMYRNRPVRCLGVEELDGWRLKVYGIAYGAEQPSAELVAAGVGAGRGRLPAPAVTGDRYGVGFLGIHEGRGGNFVFVDWWAQENELHHHVWFSGRRTRPPCARGRPTTRSPATGT